MNNSHPVESSSVPKSDLSPGCHVAVLRLKRDGAFFTLICDCCGSWSSTLAPPEGAKACMTCLRHGHGEGWNPEVE
jgi:hypothetical protein